MGAGSNNLMSTQTGGVGETIQAENTTQATPQEFQANIPPVPQERAETPQAEVPSEVPVEQIPVEENIPEQQPVVEGPAEQPTEGQPIMPTAPIETETDVINRLGLENVEPAFNEQELNTLPLNLTVTSTPDGVPVNNYQPKVQEEEEAPIIKDDYEEPADPEFTPDGQPVIGGGQKRIALADVNAKYKNEGIQVDDLGKVTVGVEEKKTAQGLPDGSYRLAGKSANYQKIDGKWYKDANLTGDYQPIGGENAESRVGYLEANAQGTVSETEKQAGEIINQRFGDLRKEVEGNRVAENSFTFDDFTKGKSIDNTQKYNADGTVNFNYDPNAAKTKETFGVDTKTTGELPEGVYKYPGSEASYKRVNGDWMIDPKGGTDFVPITKGNVAYRKSKLDTDAILQSKPDGVYIYPGSKASYKRVGGDWMIDPAGGSNYVQMTQGDVAKRKAQLDLNAVKAVKASEYNDLGAIIKKQGVGAAPSGIPSLTPSVEQSMLEKTAKASDEKRASFNKANNFANSDIMGKLTVKAADGSPIQVLTGDQMTSFLEYQNKIKDIIGDGSYTVAKAAKVEQVMKDAETYFNEAKQINAEINKARAENKSLSRVSLEKKMQMAEDLLTDSDEATMFATTANMADFVLDNVDNGKMRFDAEAGQYVISPNVSGTERQYLESKLAEYVDYYTSLQGEKYAESQAKIQDDRQKLAATKRNIVKLESSLAEMKRNGVDEKSAEYQSVVGELEKSKNQADDYDTLIDKKIYATDAAFLTEPKKTAESLALSLSQDAYNIIAAIPKDITPKQQFDLIYERLAAENDRIAKENGLNTEGLGNANMKVKDMLDWDGFYELSKAERQWLQNKATLTQMSPLYFNNSDMLSNEGTGFWESFTNSFYSTLFPNTAKAEGLANLSEASAITAQKLQEFGFNEDDFVTPEMAKKLEEQSKVDFWSMEKWGGMTGATAAIIAPLMLTAGVPSTALRVVKGVEGLVTGAEASKVAKIVNNAEKIYNNALKSTRFGRFLKPSIESAVKAEIAGDIFTSQEDELNFLSFMAGGVVAESLGAVFAKMPKDQVYKYLQGVFGNKVNVAVNTIKKAGEATARGFAETGEETGSQLTNIYMQTDNWKEMKAELDRQFGTFDKVQEFIVSSFIMGAGFGLTESKTAKDAYSKLPTQSKEQVDAAIEAIRKDLDEADSKVEEFAENKEKQQKIEKTIEENDKKDEERISGQVGEGQKPVEGQPVAGTSQEAPSPSGVVQEEQGQAEQVTPAEKPKIQKATARSVKEARELVKQGYVPANKKFSKNDIANLFNTRKKLDMVKVGEAPATEAPTAETPAAESTGEALKDVESTSKALEGKDITTVISPTKINELNKQLYDNLLSKQKELLQQGVRDFENNPEYKAIKEQIDFSEALLANDNKAISEAYHKAKSDGSNPELVKSVEELLGAAETTAEPTVEGRTISEIAKEFADKIRAGKIGGEGLKSSIPGFDAVWNTSLEAAAKVVETAGMSAETIQEAIRAGFKVVKGSDWYKGLDKAQKAQAKADYDTGMNNLFDEGKMSSAEKAAAKEFGKKVASATGTVKQPKTVQMTESEALRKQLKDKEAAGKETRIWMSKMRNQILDYAKKNLPKGEYTDAEVKKITSALKAKDLESALDRIDAIVAKKNESVAKIDAKTAERKRRATVKDIKQKMTNKRTLLSRQGNKWVGKTTVESQKEYGRFIKNIIIDELDTKTQEELNEINDIIDGIVSEGKADYKRLKALSDDAKRERAAKLIQGLAKGQGIPLNSTEDIIDFFIKGGEVVVDGKLYNKSSFKTLINAGTKKGEQGSKIDDIEEEITELQEDYNERSAQVLSLGGSVASDADLKAMSRKIDTKKKQLQKAKEKYDSMPDADVNIDGAVGYRQEVAELAKISERLKNAGFWRRTINFLNPLRAVDDLQVLLARTYGKSSDVGLFVKENIADKINDAYVERDNRYNAIIKEYYKALDDIFGKYSIKEYEALKERAKGLLIGYHSSSKALNKLAERVDGVLSSNVNDYMAVTNGHVVDIYNLSQLENGKERLEKSGINVDKAIKHIESDPQLKAYADWLMNKYKELGVDYEPMYIAYTGTPFPSGKYPYYPGYASDFERDFVDEASMMGENGSFKMLGANSAMSNNMKQRTNFQGNFNITMDAHAKFIDYVKANEHAKAFLPIAKSVNELFSTINSPHLIKQLGIEDYGQLKATLIRVLTDLPISQLKTPWGRAINKLRQFATVATLGLKPASAVLQATSFANYWMAGIKNGVYPHDVAMGIPKTKDEWKAVKSLWNSDFIKERLSGEHIDIERRRLMEKAQNTMTEKAWTELSKKALLFVRYGDFFSVLHLPGGGTHFFVALYRKGVSDGMTQEEAMDWAMKRYIETTNNVMQTNRTDLTSNMQLDDTYRMLGAYRTAQTAASKQVVKGVQTILNAYKIRKSEGKEKRKEAISNKDILQAVHDIVWYSFFNNLMFANFASGAVIQLLSGLGEEDDEADKRAFFDVVVDSISSSLQGYGFIGYAAGTFLDFLQGDDWKLNVPIIKKMDEMMSAAIGYIDASNRTWENMDDNTRNEVYLKQTGNAINSLSVYEMVSQAYDERSAFNKMTETEVNDMTKAIGINNVLKLIDRIGEAAEADKGLVGYMDAFMGWDEDYMKKANESNKKNRLYEWIYGEPYTTTGKKIEYTPSGESKNVDIFNEPEVEEPDVESGKRVYARDSYKSNL